MKTFLMVFALVSVVVAATENDVVYKQVDGLSLALDVSYPSESGSFPLVVCIHGGGWRTGDKKTWHEEKIQAQINIEELSKRGYAAASINYRLAPSYKLGAMVEDILAAVDFLLDHADAYKIDRRRIVLMGDSAGGHLALMAGINLQKAGYAVRGIVNMFGLTDCIDQSARVDGGKLSFVVGDMLGTTDPESEAARKGSPAQILDGDCPPILTLHGTGDPVIPFNQARALIRSMRLAKVGGELIPMRKQGHGWGNPKAVKKSTDVVLRFLQKVFKE